MHENALKFLVGKRRQQSEGIHRVTNNTLRKTHKKVLKKGRQNGEEEEKKKKLKQQNYVANGYIQSIVSLKITFLLSHTIECMLSELDLLTLPTT